jgi:hypothetical protein
MATKWRMAGDSIVHCNCAWGCPCQFNAFPTTGRCEAILAHAIRDGAFGKTSLAGVRYARIYSWPGAVHEGNGTRQMIVDEGATEDQRRALEALESGKEGGGYFEVFASVCPTRLDTVYAPIEIEVDQENRIASVRIPDIAETSAEPIKNPVTGDPHRARIDLPNGFEYKIAEVGNTAHARVKGSGKLGFNLENTYAQFSQFDWSNA